MAKVEGLEVKGSDPMVKNDIGSDPLFTVEMALKRDDLKGPFMNYLSDLYKSKIFKSLSDESYAEAAADKSK